MTPRRADPPSLRPVPARQGPDHWVTPTCLISALTSYVLPEVPPGRIWEPASGDGRLADAMRAVGRDVTATDAYAVGSLNFLRDAPLEADVAALVTNPPFNQLTKFIVRALQHLDNDVVQDVILLLRADHPTAQERAPLLARAYALWYCCWRPRWIEDSTTGPRWSFIWTHWKRGHSGLPQAFWLTPQMMRRDAR
jgi:hypothetical protein